MGIAPAADPPAVSPELVDEAVDRAAGRRRVREALGVPSDRRISNEVIDELLAGAGTEEEIAGPGRAGEGDVVGGERAEALDVAVGDLGAGCVEMIERALGVEGVVEHDRVDD